MKKHYNLLTLITILFLIGFALIQVFWPDKLPTKGIGKEDLVRDDIIRLHIIANSDSPDDQDLKLRVRDELMLAFSEILADARDQKETKAKLIDKLDLLTSLAQDKVKKEGYDYPVKADLGIHKFPTKLYGSVVYPAGSYEALRIIIGEGAGANWWCVMFPPLCFVDVSSSKIEPSALVDQDKQSDKAGGDLVEQIAGDKKEDMAGESPEQGQTDQAKEDDQVGPLVDDEGAGKVKTEYRFKIADWWDALIKWIKGLF